MARTLKSDLLSSTRALRIGVAVTACLAAAACQTSSSNDMASYDSRNYSDTLANASASPVASRLAARLKANPRDVNVAVSLSRQLRSEEKYDEALGSLLKATAISDNDPRLLSEMGKTLVERGSPEQGLKLLDQAASKLPADWSIMSARGIALDQLEQPAKAQDAYQMALNYSPGNPVVLANYGLSLATQGRLREAETMLRKAVTHPGATPKVNLNLALIVGLNGNFEESERIARAYLPPATVEENMAYLRSLLTQPARWRRPTDGDFDGDVTTPANVPS